MKLWTTSLILVAALHGLLLFGVSSNDEGKSNANIFSKMGVNAKTSVKVTLHSKTSETRREHTSPIRKKGKGLAPQKTIKQHSEIDGGEISAKIDGSFSPTMSWASRRKGEEGDVRLLIRVFANGKAEPIKILKSSGFKRLDKSALEAISGATFTPARSSGAAIESTMELTIAYSLE